MVVPSTSILLTAGIAAVANAAPAYVAGHRKAGSFSAPQVRAAGYVRHGPSAMAKALLKYGKEVPEELQRTIDLFKSERVKMARRGENGTATTTPEQYDVEYLTEVSIGTPAQKLTLDFDSGSSDLWVFSSETTSSDVDGQTTYKPGDSSTASKISGATWEVSYGDGSTSSGDVYTDVVTVGGVSFDKQAVEAAKTVSSSFTSDAESDGLLGLAFSSINTVSPNPQKTFFDNIKSALDQPLWTANLKHNEAGNYDFGWIDESAYTGSIAYTDIDSSEGYWMLTVSSYSTGNSSSSTSSSSSSSSSGSSSSTGSSSGSQSSGSPTGSSSGSSSSSYPSGYPTGSSGSQSSGYPTGSSSGSSSGSSGSLPSSIPQSSGSPSGPCASGSPSSGSYGNPWGGSSGDHAHHKSGSSDTGNFDSSDGFFGGIFKKIRRQFGSGSSSSSSSSSSMTAIADTGTTLALLPESVVEAYYNKISGATYDSSAGGYVFSCDATMEDFSYTIGDVTVTIPGDYINYSPVDTSGSQCYGGLQSDSSVGFSILGDIALKAAFVVFKNSGSPTIGFATKDL